MTDIFGRLITRADVQNAVTRFLAEWVPTYVGELERQRGLETGSVPMPPDPVRSYRGGLDFDTWEPSWSPVFIVVAQPIGRAELVAGGGPYHQVFDIQVACNYQYDGRPPSLGEFEEDSAIQYTDILGMAACAAVIQHGELGLWPDGSPVSTRTRLEQFPLSEFPYTTEESSRRVVRSRFTVSSVVAEVVNEGNGPLGPLANPYPDPGDWPTVKSTDVVLDAVPLTQVPAQQSGWPPRP